MYCIKLGLLWFILISRQLANNSTPNRTCFGAFCSVGSLPTTVLQTELVLMHSY